MHPNAPAALRERTRGREPGESRADDFGVPLFHRTAIQLWTA
jgi:hypothetical protein